MTTTTYKKIILSLFSIMMFFFSIQSYAETYECAQNPELPQCQKSMKKEILIIENKGKSAADSTYVKNDLKNISIPKSTIFVSLIENIMKDGDTMANRYIGTAEYTTAILGGIALVWLGIMIMLSQADIWHMGLRPLFSLLFTVGFTFWLLKDYDNLTNAVIIGFKYAAGVLIGAKGNQEVFIQLFYGFGANFISMMNGMISVLDVPFPGGLIGDITHFFSIVWDLLLDVVVIGISGGIFILLMVIFVVIYLGYQIVAGIAIAVGPVFIPFLVLPVTRPLFEGWLKMLIMSGIYLMVSTVIVGFMETAMGSYFSSMTSQTGHGGHAVLSVIASGSINLVVVIELIILEIVAVFALLKTHEFAHAIGGSVSISGMNGANFAVNMAKKAAGG